MSNWTDFRDSILDALKIEDVTEEMKNNLTQWLLDTAYPLAENAANSFIEQIKEQAGAESGWCKVRDLIVLPFVINGGLWLVKNTLTKTITTVDVGNN